MNNKNNPKKTTKVEGLRNWANEQLKNTHAGVYSTPEYRQGVISMLEFVLHETGNYHGFRYLDQRELPDGVMPGIWWNRIAAESSFKNTDRTRVYYP